MFDLAYGRACALVVAVMAPVLQHLADCGRSKTEPYDGPVYEIVGPETATTGVAATYRIEGASLGKGAPCPENVTFTFVSDSTDENVIVSIPHPPTRKLADGSCAVDAAASHRFTTAARGEVDVEVSADVLLNGRGARIITVAAPGTAGTTTSPAGTTTTAPSGPTTPVPAGTGAFAAPVQTSSPSHPVGVVAGPLGAGGALGVATIENATPLTGQDSLAVYPVGTGGALGTPVRSDLAPGSDPTAIAAADVDQDGDQDLLVLERSGGPFGFGALVTYRNTGSGFTALGSPLHAVGDALAVGDLNGDGAPDVALNSGSTSVWVYLNANDGSGLGNSPYVSSTGDYAAGSLAILDADGDGNRDIALGDYQGDPGRVGTVLGDGTGKTFGTPQDLASGSGLVPLAVTAGDVRGSSATDLVFARHTTDQVAVLRNASTTAGTAVFDETVLPADAAGKRPDGVTLGDVDGDGRLDIVTANYEGDNDSVYLNPAGDGTFGTPIHVPAGDGPQQVAVADLDGDGRRDLVTANAGNIDHGSPVADVAGTVSVALATPPPAAVRSVRAAGTAGRSLEALSAASSATAKGKAPKKVVKAGGGASITIKKIGTTSYAPDGTGRIRGAQITGRLAATLSKGDVKKLGKPAAAILKARFVGLLDVDRKVDPANGNPLIATGLIAAKGGKLQACLRATPGPKGLQHFELVAGTGPLAKLRLSGDLWPFSLDRAGKKGPKAVITVSAGTKRPVSSACRKLLRQVPKK